VAIKLLVGLGNPGPHYVHTRHNVGFWFVERWAQRLHGQFRSESRFSGELCAVKHSHLTYWLLKPHTFMNRSGQAIAALAHYYKLASEQILVIHDDLDLAAGVARLKQGGGAGGHNGLRDTITQLGSQQFWRLRLGIEHPGRGANVTAYVLNPPTLEQQQAIETAMNAALDIIPLLLSGDFNPAMQQLHTTAKAPSE